MRHAAAGNALMLNTATSASHYSHSHTTAAQPAAVGMSLKHSPLVAATGSGADGPACCSRCRTPVSATPGREGNTERIANSPHPRSRAEGASANPQVHSRGSSTGITHGGIPRLQPCGEGQTRSQNQNNSYDSNPTHSFGD
jgi:hypothetical protein